MIVRCTGNHSVADQESLAESRRPGKALSLCSTKEDLSDVNHHRVSVHDRQRTVGRYLDIVRMFPCSTYNRLERKQEGGAATAGMAMPKKERVISTCGLETARVTRKHET